MTCSFRRGWASRSVRARPVGRIVAPLLFTRSDTALSMAVHRLHRPGDISAVFAARHAAHGTNMSVYARPTDGMQTRATVVASRAVGGAVERNRARRRLRAALQSATLPRGFDLVVRARAGAVNAPYEDVRTELDRLVAKVTRRAGRAAKVTS